MERVETVENPEFHEHRYGPKNPDPRLCQFILGGCAIGVSHVCILFMCCFASLFHRSHWVLVKVLNTNMKSPRRTKTMFLLKLGFHIAMSTYQRSWRCKSQQNCGHKSHTLIQDGLGNSMNVHIKTMLSFSEWNLPQWNLGCLFAHLPKSPLRSKMDWVCRQGAPCELVVGETRRFWIYSLQMVENRAVFHHRFCPKGSWLASSFGRRRAFGVYQLLGHQKNNHGEKAGGGFAWRQLYVTQTCEISPRVLRGPSRFKKIAPKSNDPKLGMSKQNSGHKKDFN